MKNANNSSDKTKSVIKGAAKEVAKGVATGAAAGAGLAIGAQMLVGPAVTGYAETLNVNHLNRLKRYEELFGDIKELKQVAQYTGEVLDVEIPDLPDGVRIAFQRPSGELIRVFPKKRVEAIGAAFPTAQGNCMSDL